MVVCVACGSENLFVLGSLGRIMHYRCRDCGIDTAAEMEPNDPSVEFDLTPEEEQYPWGERWEDPYGGGDDDV